jgi:nitrogenase iron protein NifH
VTVTQSELQGKTTTEAAPDSEQSKIYRRLAEKVYNHTNSVVPSPLDEKELHAWALTWADQILAMESGEVRSTGASI